jgi:cytochrome P450
MVIGSSRTPTLDDRPNLPYLTACMREVFRWRTILPCTFPHQTKQQDTYMGYRIPANSTIIPLQWCMNLNDSNFNDPHTFDPSRWLGPSASELRYHAFGYGRRICPGRHIAENSVWLNMAKLVWGFDITAADDSVGRGVDPDKGWTTGFLTKPTPFKAKFIVRSSDRAAVIRREWENAEKDVDVLLAMVQERRKGSK